MYEVQRCRSFTRRTLLLGGGQMLVFGALAARLYKLQVIDAVHYHTLSESNRINLKMLIPSRGRILDRNGKDMAINRQDYRVVIVREQTPNVEVTLRKLGTIISLEQSDYKHVLREIKRKRSFVPILIRSDLSWEELARIELNAYDLVGISVELGERRYYPSEHSSSHMVGYVGAVSEADLLSSDDSLLELPDFKVGKDGIERAYDLALRGIAGISQVEVNSTGRIIREISRKDAVPGQDIELTIDSDLQSLAAYELGTQSAALVTMDIHTGEILALVSTPSFDPNQLSAGVDAAEWKSLNNSITSPLINKAIAGQYAPGSSFKVVTALAGLEMEAITPRTILPCSGVYRLGNSLFHCWSRNGHGSVDLRRAIKESCDCYFYEVARRVGIDRLAEMANRMGLGSRLNIEIPGEQPGLIPNRQWKRATLGRSWSQGETLICGIGQGYVTTTPMQLATMIARLTNGGHAVVPHLTRRIGNERILRPGFSKLNLNMTNVQAVVSGLVAATNEEGGTSYQNRITDPYFMMAGKTGSAQIYRISEAERAHGIRRQEDLPILQRDNAIFAAFAPVNQPRYACAVVVEHGMHGSWVAPVAAKVLMAIQQKAFLGLKQRQGPP